MRWSYQVGAPGAGVRYSFGSRAHDLALMAAKEGVTRDFAATTFVVWRRQVLLHFHAKHGMWLPPGGHIEPNELPDDAAVREVMEEAGVPIRLVGERALEIDQPRQLIRPRGVQLETIGPGHEHVDLIYFGRPVEGYDGKLTTNDGSVGWYDQETLADLNVTLEIACWIELALCEIAGA